MSWKQSADEIRQTLRDAIPAKWTLSPNHTAGLTDVTAVPATCGLLSADDLAITEQTATQLVAKLAAGQLSSVRVTEAFCARAAIAHQLVGSLHVHRFLSTYMYTTYTYRSTA